MLEDAANSLIGLLAIAAAAWRLPAAIQDGAVFDAAIFMVVVLAALVAIAIDLGLAVRATRRRRHSLAWSEDNERAVRAGARSDCRWLKTSFAVFALVPLGLLVFAIKEAAAGALQEAHEGRWIDAGFVMLTCGAVPALWVYWKHVDQSFYQLTVDRAKGLSPLFVATALSKAAGKHPNPGPMTWDGSLLEVSAAYEAARTLDAFLDRVDIPGSRVGDDTVAMLGESIRHALKPTSARVALVGRILRILGVGVEDGLRVVKVARAMLPSPSSRAANRGGSSGSSQ